MRERRVPRIAPWVCSLTSLEREEPAGAAGWIRDLIPTNWPVALAPATLPPATHIHASPCNLASCPCLARAADPCQRVCSRCLAAGRHRRGVVLGSAANRRSLTDSPVCVVHDEGCGCRACLRQVRVPSERTPTGPRAVLPTATLAGGTACRRSRSCYQGRCDSKKQSLPMHCGGHRAHGDDVCAQHPTGRDGAIAGAIAQTITGPRWPIRRWTCAPRPLCPTGSTCTLGTRLPPRGTATLLLPTGYSVTGCHTPHPTGWDPRPWCRSLRSGRLPSRSAATRFPRWRALRALAAPERSGTIRTLPIAAFPNSLRAGLRSESRCWSESSVPSPIAGQGRRNGKPCRRPMGIRIYPPSVHAANTLADPVFRGRL